MVHVAKEMERANMKTPLLIGGATTSRVHTAVKIDEHYTFGNTIHVLDASRSVTVVESLLGNKKQTFIDNLKVEYDTVRKNHASHVQNKSLVDIETARKNKLELSFNNDNISLNREKIGVHVLNDITVSEIIPYIDWTPFFQTWELHGRYPNILNDEVVGTEASTLFEDAQQMLTKIVSESWLGVKAVYGIFPANSVGDDIEIYTDICRSEILHTQRTLRQQTKKAKGQPNLALSDFIAPKESDIIDYIGGFAVTSGLGIERKHIEAFEKDHDDYNSIMLKALADRLAEALARIFTRARSVQAIGGIQKNERHSNEELIQEKYRGDQTCTGLSGLSGSHRKNRTLQYFKCER